MKLYGDPGSGSTRRVLTALYHIGAPFEFQNVDLFKGEHRAPAFLALNPNGMIPLLVDGDAVLYEAAAINLYLAGKFGSDLLPQGDARFLTLQWMFWAAEHWRQGPPALFNERIVKVAMGQPQDPRVIADAEASIRKFAAVLEAHLQGRRYVVGERFTLADIDLAATFSHLARTHPPYAEFPNVMAWHQRLLDEVPAWARTRDEVEVRMAALMAGFRAAA
jgi:glutathione S-transferase